jgi:simple sugar transport system permease protein
MNRQKVFYAVAAPVTAVVAALVVTALALLAGSHNPFVAYGKMIHYAASTDSVVVILNKSLPLFISGLAVAIGFKMNMFNIGVEGQYRLATIIAAAVGAELNLPGPLHVAIIMLAGMVIGAAYASVAGLLKAYRNVNEVIATIMLNGIAASLIGVLVKWKSVFVASGFSRGTKDLPRSGWMPNLNRVVAWVGFHIPKGTVLWGWILIAIVVGVVYHFIITRTRFGFDLRASGVNPGAALVSGVDPKRMIVRTMLISGALAGLVGMPIVLNDTHKFTTEFPTLYGFAGIAVALVGRQKAGGIAAAAVLFALIERSAQVLPDPPLNAPKELGTIMQGTMILSAVIAYEVIRRRAQAAAVHEAAQKAAAAHAGLAGAAS